jgi:hypothetical protein
VLVVVRVAGVVVLSGLAGELLGGSGLGAGVEVLDLGLAEDAVEGLILGLASAVTKWKTYMYVLLLGDLYTSGLLMTKRICPFRQHSEPLNDPCP